MPIELNYFGREPRPPGTFLGACWRAIGFVVMFVLLIVVVTIRAALLIAGFTLIAVGSLMLLLAGRRDAVEKIQAWRSRCASVMRLWIADIVRPLRRNRPLTLVQPLQ